MTKKVEKVPEKVIAKVAEKAPVLEKKETTEDGNYFEQKVEVKGTAIETTTIAGKKDYQSLTVTYLHEQEEPVDADIDAQKAKNKKNF